MPTNGLKPGSTDTRNIMFDPLKLRVGDMVLVVGEAAPAEVIGRGKTYLSPIGVLLASGKQRWFDMRKGTSDLVAGARHVEGDWVPL